MVEEKVNWKIFRVREQKEVSIDYDVVAITDSLCSMKKEVARLEGLLQLAKKVGIDPDNMVDPTPQPMIMPVINPPPDLIQPEVM